MRLHFLHVMSESIVMHIVPYTGKMSNNRDLVEDRLCQSIQTYNR
jgi:hypothetical protein